ncbi:MAG: hypothetical protein ACYDDF_03780 [Thermoplasmatota archaeon]
MRTHRTWIFILLVAAFILSAGWSPVEAQGSSNAPQSMNASSNQLSTPALALGLDGTGRYAVVAGSATAADCGLNKQHLFVYDLWENPPTQISSAEYPYCSIQSSTSTSGLPVIGSGSNSPSNPTPTTAVIAPSQNEQGGTTYAVGAANQVGVYTFSAAGGPNTISHWATFGVQEQVIGLAMSNDGSRVAAAVTNASATAGSLGEVRVFVVGSSNSMGTLWFSQVPYSYGHVDSLAMRNGILAVGTDSGFMIFSDTTTQGSQTSSISCGSTSTCKTIGGDYPSQSDPITHMAMSSDGSYLVYGTANGNYAVYKTNDAAGLGIRTSGGRSSAVTGVAISDDGRTFAIEWANGEILVETQDISKPLTDSSATAISYDTTLPGVTTGTTPLGLSMSVATGGYLIAPVGTSIYGYTTKPSLSKVPAWDISVSSNVLSALMSPDSNHIVTVSNSGQSATFEAYKQITQVTIIPDRYPNPYNPSQTLPLVGATVSPGTIAQFGFTLKNTGTTDDSYVIEPLIDPTCSCTVGAVTPMNLSAGSSGRVTVNLTVGKQVSPGSYPFTIAVQSQAAGAFVGSIQFFANVTRFSDVVVVPASGQNRNFTLLGGGTATPFFFDVVNTGNAPALVNLTTLQSPSNGQGAWNVTLSPYQNLEVPAGGTRNVTGEVIAPPSALNGAYTIIQVIAQVNQTNTGNPLYLTAYLNPTYGVALSSPQRIYLVPSDKTPITFTVQNSGNTLETVLMTWTVSPRSAEDTDWRVSDQVPPGQVQVNGGGTSSYTVYVQPLQQYPQHINLTLNAVVQTSVGSQSSGTTGTVTVEVARQPIDTTSTEPWWTRLVPAPDLMWVVGAAAGTAAFVRRRR